MYSINLILKMKGLKPASKLVYIYLYEKAYKVHNQYLAIKPFIDAGDVEALKMIKGTSLKELAEATGVTQRTVSRSIDALEEEGLIERIWQKSEIWTTSLNRYKVYETATAEKYVIAEV